MTYATALDMLVYFQAKELAKIATPQKDFKGGMIEPELLTALIQGDDTATWTPEQITLAQQGITAINSALTDAQREMNSYFAGRYTLPLSGETIALNPLARKCADIARYLLTERRSDKNPEVNENYRNAITWLRDAGSGRAELTLSSIDNNAAQFSDARGISKSHFHDVVGY